MLWLLIAGFFCWLILREFLRQVVTPAGYDGPDPTPISKSYVLTMAALAILFAYSPVRYWQFERMLSAKARILSESPQAKVHCNTVVDTFFDSNVFAAGHASPDTGQIVFQHPWCGRLMDHLRAPETATREGIFSVQMFAHEAMHIRGELNEARTDCQAIQRHYRAALLLGIPDRIAKEGALTYYNVEYQRRGAIGGFIAHYYSDQCAPGKALDEKLPDSTWN